MLMEFSGSASAKISNVKIYISWMKQYPAKLPVAIVYYVYIEWMKQYPAKLLVAIVYYGLN